MNDTETGKEAVVETVKEAEVVEAKVIEVVEEEKEDIEEEEDIDEEEDNEEEKVEFKGVVVEELIEKEDVPENLKDDFDDDDDLDKDEDGNFIVKEEDAKKEESKHELFLAMAEMFESLTAESVEIENPANETLYLLPKLFG